MEQLLTGNVLQAATALLGLASAAESLEYVPSPSIPHLGKLVVFCVLTIILFLSLLTDGSDG